DWLANRAPAAKSRPGDDERHVNRALVAAPFVFGVARPKVTPVIADERHDRAVGEPALRQLLAESADGFVAARDASVVVGQLLLPVAGEKRQIARDERVPESIGVAHRRDEAVAVVLEMRLQIRDDEEEGLARVGVEKADDTVRDEIH